MGYCTKMTASRPPLARFPQGSRPSARRARALAAAHDRAGPADQTGPASHKAIAQEPDARPGKQTGPAPEAWIGRQRSADLWSASTPVGRKLARRLRAAGLSVPALARAIDWRASRLYDLASGIVAMSPNLALRLARFFGGDAKTWLVCGLDEAIAAERVLRAAEIEKIVPLASDPASHPALAGRTRAERAKVKK